MVSQNSNSSIPAMKPAFGQSMTESIIIVALIAFAAIAAVSFFGEAKSQANEASDNAKDSVSAKSIGDYDN